MHRSTASASAACQQRPYTQISGGERQLVLLARALAQEPQFIVLDEPTASLDFGNQGKVIAEIKALAASGHGVLFTTHDPNHALRAANRAFLLREGTRVAEGPVGAVLIGKSWRRFTARLSSGWWTRKPGRWRSCRARVPGDAIRSISPGGQLALATVSVRRAWCWRSWSSAWRAWL